MDQGVVPGARTAIGVFAPESKTAIDFPSRRIRKRRFPVRTLVALWRLPAATRKLALEAAVLLVAARLLVTHVPMRRWGNRLEMEEAPAFPPGTPSACPVREGRAGSPKSVRGQAVAREVGRIVRKVALRLPFRTLCLPRAIATQWMLRRRGIRSRLVFGVRRDATRAAAFVYHAWVSVGGETVIGGRESRRYSAFRPIDHAGATARESGS